LDYIKKELQIKNAIIINNDIVNCFKKNKIHQSTLIARGFPKNQLLIDLLGCNLVKQIVLISNPEKIKKTGSKRYNINKNIIAIPGRNNIKIITMENVSRET
jgi:hypothetical protein